MSFTDLPCVLQDLVLDFAFKITKKELDDDFETIRIIKSWDLHPIFVRNRVWIREQWCFQDNPLQIYIPLQKLENEFSMFDMCLVFELLDRLDFRKRNVRCMGPRDKWINCLDHVEFLGLFSMFYKQTCKDPENIKPAWRGMPLFSGLY